MNAFEDQTRAMGDSGMCIVQMHVAGRDLTVGSPIGGPGDDDDDDEPGKGGGNGGNIDPDDDEGYGDDDDDEDDDDDRLWAQ